MLPITKDIETAMNRVKSSRNAYAELVKYANKYANEYASTGAELHLGPPEPAAKNDTANAAKTVNAAAVKQTPETTLPNQNKDLTISEFEIVPDKIPQKTAQNTQKRNNQRRGGFGFTLSPIITVRRPNRP
jgi:hypothetical protein